VTIPVSLVGPNVIGIRIFMCLIESLLVPAFYLLVRSVTGSAKLSLIGGAIAIVFPTWVIPSGAVMTDIPAAILIVLMTWMLIEGHRHQYLSWIVGDGLLWGVATLTRAGTLMYAPAIILWLLLAMPSWKMRLTAVVAVTIPFALVLAPWAIRNTSVHGKFVPLSTQGGVQLYIANNPESTGVMAIDQGRVDKTRAQRFPNFSEADRDKLFQAEAVKFIRENPRRFAQLCWIRFVQLWKLYSARVPLSNSLVMIASFGVALPFFLVQVIRRGWRRGPELLFLLIILSHTALHMVYGSIVRYRIPIEPLIMVMAITGFFWTLSRFRYGYSGNTSPLSLKVT